MITNLASYRTYFEQLAAQQGCQFAWANNGRVMNLQLSQVTYPLMWAPVPDVRIDRAEGERYVFSGALVVLAQCAADDWAAQDKALEDMLELATSALRQMTEDAEDQFDFDPDSVDLQQVSFWTADNDFGWKMEFTITSAVHCTDC